MRTLHTSCRVSELDVSLAFYAALGYEHVGRVDLGAGASLTMSKFPAEEVCGICERTT
jgi:lactoylglutathione lyase